MSFSRVAAINFETAYDAALWNHELDRIARLLSTAEYLLREVDSPQPQAWLYRRELWLKQVA